MQKKCINFDDGLEDSDEEFTSSSMKKPTAQRLRQKGQPKVTEGIQNNSSTIVQMDLVEDDNESPENHAKEHIEIVEEKEKEQNKILRPEDLLPVAKLNAKANNSTNSNAGIKRKEISSSEFFGTSSSSSPSRSTASNKIAKVSLLKTA